MCVPTDVSFHLRGSRVKGMRSSCARPVSCVNGFRVEGTRGPRACVDRFVHGGKRSFCSAISTATRRSSIVVSLDAKPSISRRPSHRIVRSSTSTNDRGADHDSTAIAGAVLSRAGATRSRYHFHVVGVRGFFVRVEATPSLRSLLTSGRWAPCVEDARSSLTAQHDTTRRLLPRCRSGDTSSCDTHHRRTGSSTCSSSTTAAPRTTSRKPSAT